MNEILVGIPVYNAPEHLENLLDDLMHFYSDELTKYRFVFSDDASPNSENLEILARHPFLGLKHVTLIRQDLNLGFVKNVNSILALRKPQSSFVILNTDVRVRMDFLKSMLAVADSKPNIGSITPLTSNGTLASIVQWPAGDQVNVELHTSIAASLSRDDISICVPTGVGFCMFMSADAINEIGGFSETFGAGYGEETEWCLRARAAGYQNLLALNTFVAHVGTQSFTNAQKISQQNKAAQLIQKKFPEYSTQVENHYAENSWRMYRLKTIIAALSSSTSRPIVQILHSDPDAKHAGGTEAHVRRESMKLSSGNALVFETFPQKSGIVCNLFWAGKQLSVERLSYSDVPLLLELFSSHFGEIHIHHLLNWPETLVERLSTFSRGFDIIIHDFWFLTPHTNLISIQLNDSTIRETKEKFEKWHKRTHYLFDQANQIIFPSDEMKHWFRVFLGEQLPVAKIHVKPHDLSYLKKFQATAQILAPALPKRKIAFVGSLYPHKGLVQILETIPKLRSAGYEVLIFGKISTRKKRLKDALIFGYQSTKELAELFQLHQPAVVYFNSITPESFCFAFYESLILSETAVPAVSPTGNPHRIAEEFSLGVIANGFEATDIIEATEKACLNHRFYRTNIELWRQHLVKNNYYRIELEKSPSQELSVEAKVPDSLLIYTNSNTHQNIYLQKLVYKSLGAFKMLDKILKKFPVLQFFPKFAASFLSKIASQRKKLLS